MNKKEIFELIEQIKKSYEKSFIDFSDSDKDFLFTFLSKNSLLISPIQVVEVFNVIKEAIGFLDTLELTVKRAIKLVNLIENEQQCKNIIEQINTKIDRINRLKMNIKKHGDINYIDQQQLFAKKLWKKSKIESLISFFEQMEHFSVNYDKIVQIEFFAHRNKIDFSHYPEQIQQALTAVDGLSFLYEGQNYTVHVPKELVEYHKIGSELNTCLSSYSKRVAEKKCVKLLLKREGKAVFSLQPDRGDFTNWFMYGNNNRLPSEQLLRVVKSVMANHLENNLPTERCLEF